MNYVTDMYSGRLLSQGINGFDFYLNSFCLITNEHLFVTNIKNQVVQLVFTSNVINKDNVQLFSYLECGQMGNMFVDRDCHGILTHM